MPLTPKGAKIKAAMEEEYGKKKGASVFYASANAGTIKGVHGDDHARQEAAGDELARIAGVRKKRK